MKHTDTAHNKGYDTGNKTSGSNVTTATIGQSGRNRRVCKNCETKFSTNRQHDYAGIPSITWGKIVKGA